jgi:predicted RNase H-like nuclease
VHVIGVDACKAGWVAVSLTDGSFTGLRIGASLADVLTGSPGPANGNSADHDAGAPDAGAPDAGAPDAGAPDAGAADAVGIDMPLGLLESGWRTADLQAQRLLGRRRSTVFAIPPRAVWAQESYAAANLLCRELTGQGFSVQAWGLRRKLLEANEFREAPETSETSETSETGKARETNEAGEARPGRLYEVHPELAFGALAGQPLSDSKHTPAGRERRRELLATAGIAVPATLKPLIDILDAAAVAWSAQRIATGSAVTIPDPPQYDATGREIAIRY